MIIRTSMAERAATGHPVAVPKLSQRELRRLKFTKHYVKPMPEIVEDEIEEVPVAEEVREAKEEPVVVAQPEEELVNTTAEPGTAIVRSKVLEEIENSYKKEPAEVPIKKYKVISIGK